MRLDLVLPSLTEMVRDGVGWFQVLSAPLLNGSNVIGAWAEGGKGERGAGRGMRERMDPAEDAGMTVGTAWGPGCWGGFDRASGGSRPAYHDGLAGEDRRLDPG